MKKFLLFALIAVLLPACAFALTGNESNILNIFKSVYGFLVLIGGAWSGIALTINAMKAHNGDQNAKAGLWWNIALFVLIIASPLVFNWAIDLTKKGQVNNTDVEQIFQQQ
jgi:hypothetical protein